MPAFFAGRLRHRRSHMPSSHSPSAIVFLPTTRAEMQKRGWFELDILLIGGDAYVDHPAFGLAVVGRVLEAAGWRVGIVAQPDWRHPDSLRVMGRPRLFCGVTAGNLDSMLANQTAARRQRREDAYSENGIPGRRPNYASVVYANLARQAFPKITVVVGGIEASLRRIAHYDYWQDRVRPSLLADSKADLLVYGMGEAAVLKIARRCADNSSLRGIRNTARLLGAAESANLDPAAAVALPSREECQSNPRALLQATKQVEFEQNPFTGRPLSQWHGKRLLLVEPPAPPPTSTELDRIYRLPFTRLPHPAYRDPIPAWETVRDSFTVVRGCCGACSFCGLGLHQGKFISSRSPESVVEEVEKHAQSPLFRGTVSDLGGPTANLYGCRNGLHPACRDCRRPGCLFPKVCPHLELTAEPAIGLIRKVNRLPAVKHLFVQSGIRMDVALRFPEYIEELVANHVSGHLKVAPEHLHPTVLRRMRKHDARVFDQFRRRFEEVNRDTGKEQYLVPYFIANFPGCRDGEMKVVEEYLRKENWRLRQVQDFTPLPMTPAAAMYWSGLDYETEKPIPVNRGLAQRRNQMQMLHIAPTRNQAGDGGRSSILPD